MSVEDSESRRFELNIRLSYFQADYYADPTPSFRFWSGRKNKYNSCKVETGFMCGDGARVIRFYARVIQQLVKVLDIENSSQRRLLLRPAPRRVHLARPWTQASNPTLRL